MKKAKLMLGVTALSAALLGTGYAAMTDTVNIGGTVSTANFCVQFKDQPKAESEAAKNPGNYEITEATATLEGVTGETGNSHTIIFNAENVKADVPLTYSTTIENLSSIDAQFTGATIRAIDPATGEQYPANKVNLEVEIGSLKYQGTLAGWNDNAPTIEDAKALKLEEKGEAGSSTPVEFTVTVVAPDETSGQEVDNTSKSIGFDLTFNWEQTPGTASN